MLKNALADYLKDIENEDELRWILMALLPTVGFTHVYYTHGKNEFGRDIIARKVIDGLEIQYAIQVKRGDLNQSDWRNDVMGQLSECSRTSGISHPEFVSKLPRQVVLALSGRLNTNTQTSLSGFNNKLREENLKDIEVWDIDRLVDLLSQYGLEGFHSSTSEGYKQYASFYTLYANALIGNVTHDQIEYHSRQWIDESIPILKRILRAAVESRLLIKACELQGRWYESIIIRLAAIRSILYPCYEVPSPIVFNIYYDQAIDELCKYCREFLKFFRQEWGHANYNFLNMKSGSSSMMPYLVNLARILEVTGLFYHLACNQEEKKEIAHFLADFILKEPSVGKLPSDRYAVSIVLPILALYQSGQINIALMLLKRTAIWLCDRCELGHGLAPFDAEPEDEVATLLYYPFEGIEIMEGYSSFLGTVICDLCVFLDRYGLFIDVLNDFLAVNLSFSYWQVQNTKGLLRVESDDIITFPNIEWNEKVTSDDVWGYSNHHVGECLNFTLVEHYGKNSLYILTLLLRDRYFPIIWYSCKGNVGETI